jgi:hypothetical protein
MVSLIRFWNTREHTKHALAGDDDLLRLLLDRQRPDQSRDFFRRLPFGKLTETLLTRPHASVNDLQEELARPRVEDEDSAVCGEG